MTRTLIAGALATIALAAYAADLTQFAPEKSTITFVSKQMGVPVEGKFRKFDAKIAVDPAKPENGKVQIDIDLASIDTGSKEADDEVKSKNWFHVAQFPKASFVSQGVKSLGADKYEASGKLTIKGATRDVRAPFTLRQDASGALFDGGFTINRLQFKVGEGPWGDTDTVADEVLVRFKVFAKK
jgi:polyisoprenoid-binding protein YceI